MQMGGAGGVDPDAVGVRRGEWGEAQAPGGQAGQEGGVTRRVRVHDGETGHHGLRLGQRLAGVQAERLGRCVGRRNHGAAAVMLAGDERGVSRQRAVRVTQPVGGKGRQPE